MNLLPLLFPLLPVLALAPRWIPQSGINLSGTISDLSTSWVTFTLSSHTASRAEVSLICHRASAPRSAMLTRPAEWNPPWQNYMIDMSQPGNEALLIQITPNMGLMLSASSAGLEDGGRLNWGWSCPDNIYQSSIIALRKYSLLCEQTTVDLVSQRYCDMHRGIKWWLTFKRLLSTFLDNK